MPDPTSTEVPQVVKDLFERFEEHASSYRAQGYREYRLRQEFIDPLFLALGWDVRNTEGLAEAYKDVVHEDSVRVGANSKAPDYGFRIGGVRKFFVEAKAPSEALRTNQTAAFQLRRYGWSAKLPISILTNFSEFSIYDCRKRPAETDKASHARIEYFTSADLPALWTYLNSTFSKRAILRGSFDKFVADSSRKRGTAEVDSAFLADIEKWRAALAKNIWLRNSPLSQFELNDAVQRTIDRIVFLRIAEDRGIEPYGRLRNAANETEIYARLLTIFAEADDRYNSGLFHFRAADQLSEEADALTPGLTIENSTLKPILKSLYYPESPYEFRVLPADILGQIYEQFLGKVIVPKGRTARIEEKPEIKKQGGVFYTPTFVVRSIVKDTLGHLIDGKRVVDIAKIRVLDPACGSGSFLIEAYQYLLNWHLERYTENTPENHTKGKNPKLFQRGSNSWHLTISERRRILIQHIFGVDIDPQAVEVTKLSLLLKVLEGASGDQIAAQLNLFQARALPDLGSNIRCGNSLVETDYFEQADLTFAEETIARVRPFDWRTFISEVTDSRAFDAVIGNPPYVLLQDKFREKSLEPYFKAKYKAAKYKLDYYPLFVERALSLTSKGGRASFIVPSNFLTNNNSGELRRELLAGGLERVLIIEGRVFQKASVDTCIFTLTGKSKSKALALDRAIIRAGALEVTRRANVAVSDILADAQALISAADPRDSEILRHMSEGASPLGALAAVNFGKQLRDRKKFPDEVVKIPTRQKPSKGYAECYTGRDINRYRLDWNGLACRTAITSKAGGCWDDAKQNAKGKLLCRQVGRWPDFALDTEGRQCLNTIFMINPAKVEDGNFLLAVLNSSAIKFFWLKKFYDHRDTFPKIKGTYLKRLPIPKATNDERKALAALATQLTTLAEKIARTRSEHDRIPLVQLRDQVEATLEDKVAALFKLSSADREYIGSELSKF